MLQSLTPEYKSTKVMVIDHNDKNDATAFNTADILKQFCDFSSK